MPYNITTNGFGYVALSPEPSFRKWISNALKTVGIKNNIPSRELHCTLMYDKDNSISRDVARKHMDFSRSYRARITGVTIMGDGEWQAIVLTLDSKELQQRHKELKDIGMVHSYPSFKPHISLKYKPKPGDLELLTSGRFVQALKYNREMSLGWEEWNTVK